MILRVERSASAGTSPGPSALGVPVWHARNRKTPRAPASGRLRVLRAGCPRRSSALVARRLAFPKTIVRSNRSNFGSGRPAIGRGRHQSGRTRFRLGRANFEVGRRRRPSSCRSAPLLVEITPMTFETWPSEAQTWHSFSGSPPSAAQFVAKSGACQPNYGGGL